MPPRSCCARVVIVMVQATPLLGQHGVRVTSPWVDGDDIASAITLLDHAHVALVTPDEGERHRFAAGLTSYLDLMPETQVVAIDGQQTGSIEAVCRQFERQIPGHPLARDINAAGGVAALVRTVEPLGFSPGPKRRFYVWHDADASIRSDVRLFGEVAEALLGVAADVEFGMDDQLVIHRAIFLGDALLAAYHDDPAGRLRSWSNDRVGEPFWASVSGIAAPMVDLYTMGDLEASIRGTADVGPLIR